MLVSYNVLGLYSFLKHIQKQFTRNLLAQGLFLVVHNQFIGECTDMVFLQCIYCVLQERLLYRNNYRNFLHISIFNVYIRCFFLNFLFHVYFKCQRALTLDPRCNKRPRSVELLRRSNVNIPYLLERAPMLERAPPSNQRPLFDVKYLMSTSLE